MSEDHLAHKIPPPPSPSEAEYDSIYSAMMETAQGRRFLDEYARRTAAGETGTGFAAIRRTESGAPGEGAESLDLFLFDVADMAQAIARAKAEIAEIKPPPDGNGQIDDATGELDSIVRTTESATSHILAAAEHVQEIAWTLREKGIDDSFCDQIDAQAIEIYTSCSFQDLTGQRIRKVIQVLRYLEHRINTMIEIWGKDVSGTLKSWESSGKEARTDGSPLSPAGLNQADIDVMMQPPAPHAEETREDGAEQRQELRQEEPQASLESEAPEQPQAAFEQGPQEERQDATLEDIERVMMALDPLVAARQDEVILEQPTVPETTPELAPDISFAEQRPELSTAAAVLNEAAGVIPSQAEALAMQQAAIELAAELAEETEAEDAESDAAAQEPVAEFAISAPATAGLLQVQAAAPQPAAEPAWSVPERLALTFLPQPSAPNPPPPLHQPPEPATAATGLAPPAATAEPVVSMPPAELDFPAAPATGAADVTAKPEPEPAAAVTWPTEAADAKEAAVAAEPEPAADLAPVLETEADDFLFAPEPPAQESGPADFLLEPKPAPAAAGFENLLAAALEVSPADAAPAPPAQPLPAMQLLGVAIPEPSPAATPAIPAPASLAALPASKPAPRAPNDPLAPLRAMSDEEKIALFS